MARAVLKGARVLPGSTRSLPVSAAPRWLTLALGFLAASLGFPRLAQAQNVSMGIDVTRSESARPVDQFPLYISYDDCISDDTFGFPLNLTNLSVPSQVTSIEVWLTEGGTNECTLNSSRAGVAPVCKLVYQQAAGQLKAVVVEIPARDIANALTGTGCVDGGANTLPREVRLYFLAIRSSTVGGDVPVADAVVFDKAKVDLLGPTAPTGITAGIGENALVLSYTPSTEQDTLGYQFFCDPGGLAPAEDAGTDAAAEASDAGVEDASVDGGDGGDAAADASEVELPVTGDFPGAASCPPSDFLVPGRLPTGLSSCGTSRSPKGVASGLTNGVETTVGIAAFDAVGNLGKLSDLVCATPNPVDDFFKLYRQAGGQAGGGFCSIGSLPEASLFGLGLLGTSMALVVRRRRRDAVRPDREGRQ